MSEVKTRCGADVPSAKAFVFTLLILLLILPGLVSVHSQTQQEDSKKKQVTTYTLSPEKYQKAVAYSRAKYILYFISIAYGGVVLIALIRGKVAPRYRDLAERSSSRRFLQVLVYTPLLILTIAVLELPLDIYAQWLVLKYDQSIQSWPSWAWDWTKGQLISLIIISIVTWILYSVIRKSPRIWWFYFWLASLPIIVFLVFITPVIIEPLFFKFEPLDKTHADLVTEIQKVTARGGLEIPRERMFEMKASEKLKAVNAYVTGFSASKRVVVWDTTLQKMTTPQTLFVFGHEMGHYVLNHIRNTIAFISVVLLLFLYIGYRSMNWVQARWGSQWKIHGVDDLASLPVLMIIFGILLFLATPVFSSYSRHQEHEADIYGLEVVHGIIPDSQKAAAEAFQILGEINLSDPNPNRFIKIWLYSHPPLNERIVFARTYDPWSQGKPKYVK